MKKVPIRTYTKHEVQIIVQEALSQSYFKMHQLHESLLIELLKPKKKGKK